MILRNVIKRLPQRRGMHQFGRAEYLVWSLFPGCLLKQPDQCTRRNLTITIAKVIKYPITYIALLSPRAFFLPAPMYTPAKRSLASAYLHNSA